MFWGQVGGGGGGRSVREGVSWGSGVGRWSVVIGSKKSQNDFLTLNIISSSYYFTIQIKLPLKTNQCSKSEVIKQKQGKLSKQKESLFNSVTNLL